MMYRHIREYIHILLIIYNMYKNIIKRFFDILISALVLILFCWLFAILALLVRTKLGSPVIFTQQRPGKIDSKTGKERIFKLCKFRTMTDERDENGNLLPDKDRLTKFGKLLRSTSLDELPEFWNILKGDMSFIGPRPLLVSYLPWYTERERLRHTVRPGLTGLAQISGRNNLAWDQRFETDVKYVENLTFAMDVKIVFTTVKKIFVKEDVAEDTSVSEGNFAEIRKAQSEAGKLQQNS